MPEDEQTAECVCGGEIALFDGGPWYHVRIEDFSHVATPKGDE